MFETHLYSFGGKFYKQRKGGPIGLRGTCAIARLVMCIFDKLWKERLQNANLQFHLYARYMEGNKSSEGVDLELLRSRIDSSLALAEEAVNLL